MKGSNLIKIFVGMLAALLPSHEVRASAVLYYSDFYVGTDSMSTALSNLGETVTRVSTQSDLSAYNLSNFNLVIAFTQNNSALPGLQTNLDNYLIGGGRVIFTDWTLNNGELPSLNANFGGSFNQGSFSITDPSLLVGLINPVLLSNPGWGIFSMDLNVLPGGTAAATFPDATAAIVIGNSGRSYFNGFLGDTIADPNVATTFFENEVRSALGASVPVPEPTSLILVFGGLAGLFLFRPQRATPVV